MSDIGVFLAGSSQTSSGSVFLSAAARRSDPPQQRTSHQKRTIQQDHAQKQTQDTKDAETHQQPEYMRPLL